MRKVINKLRQKPENEKRQILHVALFIAAIILIALWILSLGRTISSSETKTKIKQDLKPFSILKNSVMSESKTGGDNTQDIQ